MSNGLVVKCSKLLGGSKVDSGFPFNSIQNIGEAYLTDLKCAEFTEHISKSIKLKLADDLVSCNYYSYLNDGSRDSSETEEEVIFILLLK